MERDKNLILIKGVNKTAEIDNAVRNPDGVISIRYRSSNPDNQNSSEQDKTYNYNPRNVVWLTEPEEIQLGDVHIYIHGKASYNLESLRLFTHSTRKYWYAVFTNGAYRYFTDNEVEVIESCLTGQDGTCLFSYLKDCAMVNTLGRDKENPQDASSGFLFQIYSSIGCVDRKSAASLYLDPGRPVRSCHAGEIIFPFGCNGSQIKAVRTALEKQISVIQGPPGTGKTQTILNIIANLVIHGKSALVVSNNNSAIRNVAEKLAAYGLDFLVAPLGSKDNIDNFIAGQPPLNAGLTEWKIDKTEEKRRMEEASETLDALRHIFADREELARCRQELAEISLEKEHFDASLPGGIPDAVSLRRNISSATVMRYWLSLQKAVDENDMPARGPIDRLRQTIRWGAMKYIFRLGLTFKKDFSRETASSLINQLQALFYNLRISELESRVMMLESRLETADTGDLASKLASASMTVMKSRLARRFDKPRRKFSSRDEILKAGKSFIDEYPVVSSTTFSARLCVKEPTLFDYVIMDEASQVSLDTGFLALTCARNAVIVGDTRQLPNVIKDHDKKKLEAIGARYDIAPQYNCARQSFLSSVLGAVRDIPATLLREHYRCHPDIIGFCNQKFYDGELLIMTSPTPGKSALRAITTVEGHHSRGHYNQREIDVIKEELLPRLSASPSDIGIIAPYNPQVGQIKGQLDGIETATVHKFQGREKDTIILSVTDDLIREFADDPNLLNVAVSRAKNEFCLVVSGNPQQLKGNISDLLEYIRYHGGICQESRLHSIFDYLYSQYTGQRRAFMARNRKVSRYDSENLTSALISSILESDPRFSHLHTLHNYPIRALLKDTSLLSTEEYEFAMRPATHIDFLITNKVCKTPALAIETDGYNYHHDNPEQSRRDAMEDHILSLYAIPCLRLSTVGHSEEKQIREILDRIVTGVAPDGDRQAGNSR